MGHKSFHSTLKYFKFNRGASVRVVVVARLYLMVWMVHLTSGVNSLRWRRHNLGFK